MQRKNDSKPFERCSKFNDDRRCYLDSDFNYVYEYEALQDDGTYVTRKCVIPYSEENREIFIILDRDDYEADLSDRYENDNTDTLFQLQTKQYESGCDVDSDGEDDMFRDSPLQSIPDPDSDVFTKAFPEYAQEEEKDPREEELHEWIQTLPESQQNLIYAHLGERKFLEDIRREEEAATGKKITKQAMHNRWMKIIAKACKHYEVPKLKQQKDR